jgi:hypothetical protein
MTTATRAIRQLGLVGVGDSVTLKGGARPTPCQQGAVSQKGVLIGDKWKIHSDGEMNIVLSKRHKSRWEPVGYFFKLTDVYCYLVHAEVRASDLSDLKVTVAKIEKLKADILGLAAG